MLYITQSNILLKGSTLIIINKRRGSSLSSSSSSLSSSSSSSSLVLSNSRPSSPSTSQLNNIERDEVVNSNGSIIQDNIPLPSNLSDLSDLASSLIEFINPDGLIAVSGNVSMYLSLVNPVYGMLMIPAAMGTVRVGIGIFNYFNFRSIRYSEINPRVFDSSNNTNGSQFNEAIRKIGDGSLFDALYENLSKLDSRIPPIIPSFTSVDEPIIEESTDTPSTSSANTTNTVVTSSSNTTNTVVTSSSSSNTTNSVVASSTGSTVSNNEELHHPVRSCTCKESPLITQVRRIDKLLKYYNKIPEGSSILTLITSNNYLSLLNADPSFFLLDLTISLNIALTGDTTPIESVQTELNEGIDNATTRMRRGAGVLSLFSSLATLYITTPLFSINSALSLYTLYSLIRPINNLRSLLSPSSIRALPSSSSSPTPESGRASTPQITLEEEIDE